MNRWKSARPLSLALAALVFVSLAGCLDTTATQRIVAFSEAVELVTTNVEDSFDAVDTAHFDAEVAHSSRDKPTLEQFNPDHFRTWLPAAELNVRMTLLDSLANYAEALAQVMSDEQLTEFDAATKAFGGKLQSLTTNESFKVLAGNRLGPNEASILASAVNAIGRWFIEYKRNREVKAVIFDMDPHVKTVSEFLQKDFEALRSQSRAAFNEQMTNVHGFIVAGYDDLDPVTRYQQIGGLANLVRRSQMADLTLERASASMTKLAETHAQLHKAFEDNAFSLDASIRSLINEGQRIKDFYDSLNAAD